MIDPRHCLIIDGILRRFPYQFYLFGSRARGDARRFSDLDLCYHGVIPPADLADLREAFDQSDLPFTVDFVPWDSLGSSFQDEIRSDLIAWGSDAERSE